MPCRSACDKNKGSTDTPHDDPTPPCSFLRLTTLPEDGSGSQPKRVSSGSIGFISGGLGFSMGLWSRGQFSSQRNMWNAMVKQVNIAISDAKKMHLENFDLKGSLKKPYCRWKNYMTSRGDVEQKKKNLQLLSLQVAFQDSTYWGPGFSRPCRTFHARILSWER